MLQSACSRAITRVRLLIKSRKRILIRQRALSSIPALYSYAIRDALASITVPKVEIHISNIMEREDFRKVSVTAPVCDKQIYGHGLNGYLEAIDFVLEKLDEQE